MVVAIAFRGYWKFGVNRALPPRILCDPVVVAVRLEAFPEDQEGTLLVGVEDIRGEVVGLA